MKYNVLCQKVAKTLVCYKRTENKLLIGIQAQGPSRLDSARNFGLFIFVQHINVSAAYEWTSLHFLSLCVERQQKYNVLCRKVAKIRVCYKRIQKKTLLIGIQAHGPSRLGSARNCGLFCFFLRSAFQQLFNGNPCISDAFAQNRSRSSYVSKKIQCVKKCAA